MTPTTKERAAAVVTYASEHGGLFRIADAVARGLNRQFVYEHARAGGLWTRRFPTVFEILGAPIDDRRSYRAALLWAGDRATLSHRSAAAVLGLDGSWDPPIEIWSPCNLRAVDGIVVHRGAIQPDDVMRGHGLRHTTGLRTLCDLAGVLGADDLELALESALRLGHVEEHNLAVRAGDGRRRGRGARRLTAVLQRRPAGAPPTGSLLETKYIQLLRTHTALPLAVRQHPVAIGDAPPARLDVCWPDVGLWVELDGRGTHDRPEALLYDRHRQNQLLAELDWLLLRFTWDDVIRRPRQTASTTEAAYHRRLEARRHVHVG